MMAGRTDLIYIYLIYLTNKRCFWVGWLGAKLVGCVGKHMQRRETLAKTWSRVALLPLFVLECLLPFNIYIFFGFVSITNTPSGSCSWTYGCRWVREGKYE